MFKSKNTHLFLFALSLLAVLVNLVLVIRDQDSKDQMNLFLRVTSIPLFLFFTIDHFLSWKNFNKRDMDANE
jgi:quinol-cytochrome oxidoreductase complex cytochrome b subunit